MKLRKRILLFILFGVALVIAEVARVDRNNTFIGYNNMATGSWRPPEKLVSTLPSAATVTGKVYVVTDGISSSDCTVGGGSTRSLCVSNGATWVALGGSGGGTGVTQAILQSGINTYCIDATGSTTAYTCSMNTLAAYTIGMYLIFIPQTTNSTVAPSVNINTLGAKVILRQDSFAPSVGELVAAKPYILYYNGTNMLIVAPLKSIDGDCIGFTGFQANLDTTCAPTLAGSNTYTNTNDYSGGTLRNTIGTGVPSAGTCNIAGHVGRTYTRSDAQTTGASYYSCDQTGVGTYGWELIQGAGGSGAIPSGFYLSYGGNSYCGPTHQQCYPASGLTILNTAGSSSLISSGGTQVLKSIAVASDNFVMGGIAIAGGNTSLITVIKCQPWIPPAGATNPGCGVAFRESATGKLIILAQSWIANSFGFFALSYYTNQTTANTTLTSYQTALGASIWWAKLTCSVAGCATGNITFQTSPDGLNFSQGFTEAVGAHFTTAPNQWGVVGSPDSTTNDLYVDILSFRVQ